MLTVELDGGVTVEPDPLGELPADAMLTTAEVAEALGMSEPVRWRSLVSRKRAPVADDPGDLSVDARRRSPRWRVSTVRQWREERPSASWKRKA